MNFCGQQFFFAASIGSTTVRGRIGASALNGPALVCISESLDHPSEQQDENYRQEGENPQHYVSNRDMGARVKPENYQPRESAKARYNDEPTKPTREVYRHSPLRLAPRFDHSRSVTPAAIAGEHSSRRHCEAIRTEATTSDTSPQARVPRRDGRQWLVVKSRP